MHPGAGQAGRIRHRVNQASAGQPVVPPPRLGEPFRRRNLFLLPADDDAVPATDDTEAR